MYKKLTLTRWVDFSKRHIEMFILFSPESRFWHFMPLYSMKTLCMKRQFLFSGKNKRKISICRLPGLAKRMAIAKANCQACHVCITKTCLYNFDPLKPHFFTVKLGFTGVYIIFLILLENIDCGYSLEPPRRGGSNEYPQSMFWAEIWKISVFHLKIFSFERWNFLYIWIDVFS